MNGKCMRLNEIKRGMFVWMISPYNNQKKPATVIGLRHLKVNGRWMRYVSLSYEFNNCKYYTTAWARNLRKSQ
jgi:hypothetical protein